MILRLVSIASLILLPLVARAEDQKPDADNTPLHQAMEKMGKTFRNLGRGLRNPVPADKTAYLEQIQTLQLLAVEAKAYTPPSIEKLPEAERPAQLAAFRSDLAATVGTMIELERAILADDWNNVKALAQKLGEARKDGHKKYNPDPDEKKS